MAAQPPKKHVNFRSSTRTKIITNAQRLIITGFRGVQPNLEDANLILRILGAIVTSTYATLILWNERM